MEKSSTRLATTARARVKTGLGVYFAELGPQNQLSAIAQLLGSIPKR